MVQEQEEAATWMSPAGSRIGLAGDCGWLTSLSPPPVAAGGQQLNMYQKQMIEKT